MSTYPISVEGLSVMTGRDDETSTWKAYIPALCLSATGPTETEALLALRDKLDALSLDVEAIAVGDKDVG